MFHDMFLKMVSFTLQHVDVRLMGMIIRVRFTSLFVYWDCLYITDLKINLCQGENTPFVETHARLDYGFCQDSWAGDLSVMTFTTMLSVIFCVFCYLSPRIFTGNIGSNTSFLLFPMSVVIFDLSISGSVNFNILQKQISRNLRIHLQTVNYIFSNLFWSV